MRADPVAPVVDPQATTGPAGSLTDTSAVVGGSVTPGGMATRWRVDYGTTPSYGHVAAAGYAGDGHGPVPLAAALGGLAPATTYHYRVVAESAAGLVFGPDLVLTTAPAPAGGEPAATPGGAPPSPAPVTAPSALVTPARSVAKAPAVARRAAAKKTAAPCRSLKGARRTACLRARKRAQLLRAERRANALRACRKLTGSRRTACVAKVRQPR
jgi:hypothetical protein